MAGEGDKEDAHKEEVARIAVVNDAAIFNCPSCNIEMKFTWPPMWPLTSKDVRVTCKACSTKFDVYQEAGDGV